MAGDQEPPVRYRGEPPRYSERVVDPENPVPTRQRGRSVHDDEWGAEAYAPGLPNSGYGGAPADWDDVPLRPIRRRSRHEEPGRIRRDADADAAEEAGRAHRRPRGDSDAEEAGRTRGSGSRGSTRRRTLPELSVEDPRRRSGVGADHSTPAREGDRAGRARPGEESYTRPRARRAADPSVSGRDTDTGRGRTRGDGGEAREERGARGDAHRGDSGADGHVERTVGAGTEGAVAARPGTDTSRTATFDTGQSVTDGDGTAESRRQVPTDGPGADPANAETAARQADTDPASADAAPGGEPPANIEADDPRGHGNAAAAHDTSPSGRKRRRVSGPDERPDDREISYANGTPDPSDPPAGFDRLPPSRTRGGRTVTGDDERVPRRGSGYDNGSGAERSADRRSEGAARRGGRGQRTLRDRSGSKMASYEQLSEAVRRGDDGDRRNRRNRPAKKKNQGPPLLDDAARARLEAVAREGVGLRAAWAAFRIRTDDLRRVNAAARIESVVEDGFDRGTSQLTDRGYIGAGGGRMNVVGRPVEYRATTAQVAGLWPWSVGAGAPLIGTPLGSHLHTGAPVCFDPMNWFMRGSFITAPSLFVLGLNGFGKSSLVRRIVLGGVAQGITPLILADVKPDYRKMVEMVGGQVIDLGYGHGKLNPLAGGVLGSIVPLLADMPALQLQVTQELRARQVTLIAGLVELVRGARVRDYEETLISTALRILYREGSGFAPESPPIMDDLLDIVIGGGQELMLDAGADNTDEYHEATKGLRRSLRALTQGPFGAVFNGQTTTPIDTSAVAVCIDVSHIPSGDKKLKAAVMLACWADGFASVEAAHVLADGKLGPQRYFQVVMDELWQVLGLGDFMVDRVDELTRLQRGMATSLIMISHTIKDLQSLGSEAAIAKALGFLERARAKIFGALPPEEISRLDSTIPFTSAEEEMVTSWSAPQALTGEALKPGQARPPAPGTGKFLLKIGEDRRPGIPFQMEFTASEKESGIHETNQRFSEFTESTARRGDEGSAA
ncbi:hypothetical protein [Nocardia spumae]|uniref:hypothetical protein n=1 Tax=Nocardia spumae TaxID=2887190 RepID=UPI001D15B631|nr:hypothetical protein [Nocardia spumae]